MKKTPKYLITSNTRAKSSGEFLIHTQDPFFIAEIKSFTNENERLKYLESCNYYATLEFNNIDYVVNVLKMITETEEWQQLADQEFVDKVSKLMSRTGDWYYSHLKFIQNEA